MKTITKAKKAVKKVTKTAKKAAKKVVETVTDSKYNKFGVCLDCNGGNPDCLHNNLTEAAGKTYCVTCGMEMN